MADIWSRVKERMKLEIPKTSYFTWIEGTTAELDDDILTVYCDSDFKRDWLESQYKDSIFHILKEVSGQTYELSFEVASNDGVISSRKDSGNTMVTQQSLEEKILDLEKTIENLQSRLLVLEENMGQKGET